MKNKLNIKQLKIIGAMVGGCVLIAFALLVLKYPSFLRGVMFPAGVITLVIACINKNNPLIGRLIGRIKRTEWYPFFCPRARRLLKSFWGVLSVCTIIFCTFHVLLIVLATSYGVEFIPELLTSSYVTLGIFLLLIPCVNFVGKIELLFICSLSSRGRQGADKSDLLKVRQSGEEKLENRVKNLEAMLKRKDK